MVTQTTSLQGALVLACSPARKPIGMRAAGQELARGRRSDFSPTRRVWSDVARMQRSGIRDVCCVSLCANARCFGAGVRPAAEILSFASPKESIQRKGDPGYAPCGFPVLLTICGGCGTRGLQPLKQSSPTTPQLSAMLGAPHGSPFVVA